MTALRGLPSVHRLVTHPQVQPWVARVGHTRAVKAARQVVTEARDRVRAGQAPPPLEGFVQILVRRLERMARPSLRPVINATGVILHTNLGRAPLSREALEAMVQVASGYSNLEYDLHRGRRGSRQDHVVPLLQDLTGADDALVVNNNAAAVLLILQALARRRRVLIARSQLVEIGGRFRIPDILAQSGAKLVEVGTTNRVHLEDYSRALAEQPIALLLWVHRSNFRIVGFHSEPGLDELARLAQAHDVPLVADVGSGALLDTRAFGLPYEPTVQGCLAAGADLVAFSGDKLLGGPQAGIVVGRKALVAKLRKHPLYRALRPDKLTLAALEATLRIYAREDAVQVLPLWRMVAADPEQLRERAEAWRKRLGTGEVRPATSAIGGGSLPAAELPTYVLALRPRRLKAFVARLRAQEPPILARVEDDAVLLDPRTVFPEQEEVLLKALSQLLLEF